MEVSPIAILYNKEIKDVFLDQNDINDIMSKYSVFVQVVVNTVHKVHLCSKTIATKVENLYGKSNFGKLFASNRDKFFSLSDTKFDTCRHPEAILNRGYWNSRVVKYASEWDIIYTNLRNYFQYDNGVCLEATDLVELKPCTAAFDLLVAKEKETRQ